MMSCLDSRLRGNDGVQSIYDATHSRHISQRNNLNVIGMDWDGVTELTMNYVQNEFNPATPDSPEVSYFSYPANGLFIMNPLMVGSAAVVSLFEGVNDGLCSVASAKWGLVLGTLNADHLDEIGQVLGITEFDYLGFYLNHAKLLKTKGF